MRFIAMERVEGKTLRELLHSAPLPIKRLLDLAMQMAEGLAKAHEAGIVHRDLKPENIMVTGDGLVKILDFGLAKLTQVGSGSDEISQLPTESGTSPGLMVGTIAYMSPEQASGQVVGTSSDQFALGSILYEMATGKKPFQGATVVDTLSAILHDEPEPVSELNPGVPAPLRWIIERCHEKEPGERYDSTRDLARELASLRAHLSEATPSTALAAVEVPTRRRRRWALPAVAMVAVAALLVGVLADRLWLRPPGAARAAGVLRSQVDLTAELPLGRKTHPARTQLALSPDGTLLAWASSPDRSLARAALHLLRLDTGEVKRLPGTEGASQPVFSPDGRWIAFSAAEGPDQPPRLRKVLVEGGLAIDLAELSSWPMGASWGSDGRILLGSGSEGVRWVPAEGGPLHELTTADKASEAGHRLPSILPGGRTLLVTTMPIAFGVKARIETVSLPGGERKIVVEDGANARYLPTGHLVFVRQGVLMAAPFDLERLELAAPPVPVVEGVSQALNLIGSSNNSGAAQLAVSDSGLLVYASGGIFEDTPVELVLVDEAGNAGPLPGFDKPLVYADFKYSPDGRQLAFVEKPRSGLLWLFDVERQTYRVLSDRGQAASPRWSPDGTRLVMSWTQGGPFHLWVWPLHGGDRERLTEGEYHDWAPSSWSPDGRQVAFVRLGPSLDVFLHRFEDRQTVPFLATQAQESHPEFSPDGRWLAYASSESGRSEVYVTSFPDREQTITVSRQGGTAPAWSRDGRRLFYYSHPPASDGRRSMMVVSVRHGPALSLGQPETLFRLPDTFVALNPMRSYDLHPDGQRFLIGVMAEQSAPAPITRLHLVQNWFEELERLAPTD